MERTLGHVLCEPHLVNKAWSGELVKTVPDWVRKCEIVPVAHSYASLAGELRTWWDKDLYNACYNFWMLWHSHKRRGNGMTILGASGAGKSFGAAALANEIEHSWGRDQHINVQWVSVPWAISELLDFKTLFMKEQFLERKWAWYKADLLILDDIFQIPAANSFAVVAEIIAMYHYRMDNLLPTVITGNAESDPWGVFAQVFNAPFARRVRDNCAGRTLILGGS